MKKYFYILSAIIAVIILPFLLRRSNTDHTKQTDDTVVIITPTNEAVLLEMGIGFQKWYLKKTGRTIKVDWRTPGSTGIIVRYIHSAFLGSFRTYWEQVLKRKWTYEVQENFVNPTPTTQLGKEVRSCYLTSHVSCGIDLFMGGGVVEQRKEAELGNTVPIELIKQHPEWFHENCIPAKISGGDMYDPQGAWFGTCISSFGIMYNNDCIRDLKIPEPKQWSDLALPQFYHQIAMVDPVQSSVVIKCLEMIIQQQMQQVSKEILQKTHQTELTRQQLHIALNKGWIRGLKLIQKIMANSRYFTDNSIKSIWDVNVGNCAVGVVVDFYGRNQRNVTIERGGSDRIRFILPQGGSCWSPDPISLFRGAPNPKPACAFIEYALSEEGQDCLGFKVGTKNGPQYYALHRTPLRKDFYTEEKEPFMLTPDMNPFHISDDFTYQTNWTAPIFHSIRLLSKVLFMDLFTELSQAWKAIFVAQQEGRHAQAQQALKFLENFHEMTYDWAFTTLNPLLESKDTLKKINFETELTKKFQKQYLKAYSIASQR